MVKLLLNVLFLLSPTLFFSQNNQLYFSDAIKIDFDKYKAKSQFAYQSGDIERGRFLFDSLVEYRLKNTVFDDFVLKKVNGGELKISELKKPVVLITYASWCVFSKGEIQALNKLVRKYGSEVNFVLLFWDKKHNAKKASRKFHRQIIVCYAHEHYKHDAHTVASIKHTLGFPTSFYLDKDKKIITIRRTGIHVPYAKHEQENRLALNYNAFLDGLTTIILNEELNKETLAIN
ncbi:MAG: hypothetical protein BM557_01780 [Flavobacterium sp. MedPE-SWcel]|uniref:TlpA family protein disulfide reductase n=1 Tax=uncultured Flavobacterium sp. TaxID=165435 RepID=UPI0009216648|nr:redoxin domain-containing protein [uncultured Flavobacterium sp.]OIQ22131.1 MAG: hypothetical protein BM557_01780 [Flavobacterium sp. MedPE-SWcel]